MPPPFKDARRVSFAYPEDGRGLAPIDLALLLLGNPENMGVTVLAGVLGHLCNFQVKYLFSVLSVAPVGSVALGLPRSLETCLIFGVLSGILGALTLITLRKAGFFAYLEEKL
jgi:hypothetical protein